MFEIFGLSGIKKAFHLFLRWPSGEVKVSFGSLGDRNCLEASLGIVAFKLKGDARRDNNSVHGQSRVILNPLSQTWIRLI
eukprot:2000726-Pyramimonas_sp.AAC.1